MTYVFSGGEKTTGFHEINTEILWRWLRRCFADLNSFDFPPPTSKKSTSVASLVYCHIGGMPLQENVIFVISEACGGELLIGSGRRLCNLVVG